MFGYEVIKLISPHDQVYQRVTAISRFDAIPNVPLGGFLLLNTNLSSTSSAGHWTVLHHNFQGCYELFNSLGCNSSLIEFYRKHIPKSFEFLLTNKTCLQHIESSTCG